MSRLILFIIKIIAKVHDKIMLLNDSLGWSLSDKWLHFIVIGIFGFCLLLVIQPLFKWLSSHNKTIFISFIYVFTVVVVVTFAIEIGQKYTGSSDMDFYDVVSGIAGFFVFFVVYLAGYLIFKRLKQDNSKINNNDEKRIK